VIAQQHRRVAARERRLADEHLVHDESQAVHVGRDGCGPALDALGRDVERRREELGRIRILGGRAGDPEVADLGLVVLVEQDVRRLQVRMDDAA